MDNQHRKIATYRELSQEEIDLMNRIKQHEAETMALMSEVEMHIKAQREKAKAENIAASQQLLSSETFRLNNAEPERWLSIARTDIQKGFMSFVRAVAQPTTPW
jgi:hypothetical protein